jgi:hypothetical protein
VELASDSGNGNYLGLIIFVNILAVLYRTDQHRARMIKQSRGLEKSVV